MTSKTRSLNRLAQLSVQVGVISFSAGMFYWLYTLQWQGIAAGLIAFITMIMTAFVVNVEVRTSRLDDDDDRFYSPPPATTTTPNLEHWVPPNDGSITGVAERPPTNTQPQPTEHIPSASTNVSHLNSDWKPRGTPPDLLQKKDPFATRPSDK